MNEKIIMQLQNPSGAEFTLREPDYANDMKLEIDERKYRTTIKFRNVGIRNKESSIQFSWEQYNKFTNRTKSASFSIPIEMAEIFLKHISTPRN